jgi:hypothetical protein
MSHTYSKFSQVTPDVVKNQERAARRSTLILLGSMLVEGLLTSNKALRITPINNEWYSLLGVPVKIDSLLIDVKVFIIFL